MYSVVLRPGHYGSGPGVRALSEHTTEAAAHAACRRAGARYRVVCAKGPWFGWCLDCIATVAPPEPLAKPATLAEMQRYIMGPEY
jgi:hypothetical protein